MNNSLVYNTSRRSHSISDLNTSNVSSNKQEIFQTFIKHSEDEKSMINECNGLLTTYLEQVKTLEGENSLLLNEIKELSGTWDYACTGAQVQLEHSLDGLRSRLEASENLRCDALTQMDLNGYESNEYYLRVDELKCLLDAIKEKSDRLRDELNTRVSQAQYVRDSYEQIKYELVKNQTQRDATWTQLVELYKSINFETLKRLSTENSIKYLQEKINFLKKIFEKQEEYVGDVKSGGGGGVGNEEVLSIEFYKNNLKRVLKDIRKDYEQLADEQTKSMRQWMTKISSDLKQKYTQPMRASNDVYIEEENIQGLKSNLLASVKELNETRNANRDLLKRLNELEEHAEQERNRINETIYQQNVEINRLNDDVQELTNDCFHLDAYKAIHDSELQVYKRLVDSEMKRLEENTADRQHEKFSISIFEGKVKNRKEIYGEVGIDEVSPNGQYILIRNYGQATTVDLTGWSLKRKLGNVSTIEYNFPNNTKLMPNECVRLWGSLFYSKETRDKFDLLNGDIDSWGFGVNTSTHLLNTNLDCVSSFYQQIDFDKS